MFLKDLQEEDFEIAVKVKNIPFLRNLFYSLMINNKNDKMIVMKN